MQLEIASADANSLPKLGVGDPLLLRYRGCRAKGKRHRSSNAQAALHALPTASHL
jgi:hypothetical protein